jgi:hypothetical protein
VAVRSLDILVLMGNPVIHQGYLWHDGDKREVVGHVCGNTPVVAPEETQRPDGLYPLRRGDGCMGLETEVIVDGHAEIP